ncbi:MAG TPA: sensor histidine kinase [Candidatus Nanoarchaeia archaeon]|nr:sensor histidine kinase [Candidatus Nanoarchaeia archaeon]
MRIGTKLLIIGFLVLFSVLMSWSTYYYISHQALKERVESQLATVVGFKEYNLDEFIDELARDLASISKERHFLESFIQMKAALEEENPDWMQYHVIVKGLLSERLDLTANHFKSIYILDIDSHIHASTDSSSEGKSQSAEPYFIQGKKGAFVQNYYYDEQEGDFVMLISTPLLDADGNVIGVLAAIVNNSQIDRIMAENIGLGSSGESFIVDDSHIPITPLMFEYGSPLDMTIHTESVEDCIAGNNGVKDAYDYRGVRAIVAYSWLPDRELCIISKIDKDEAFSQINWLRSASIVIGVILTLLFSLAGAFFTSNITKPIEQLNYVAKELENGNFKARTDINTGDELEELGKETNKTIQILGRVDDERKQIDHAKTEFLSITSHELRSPITPMKAQLQMLEKGYFGKLGRKQKEAIDIVLRNTERLDNIILDFLEISRIEAARLKFQFVRTDMVQHIKRVIEEMKAFMPEKKIRIISRIGELPVIETDPDRIMQVLRNLINNAVKFSKDKGTVEVTAKAIDDGILFSVKDYGVGISSGDLMRLFEPFFQAEKTIYRKYGGTGLGLAICKGIVESQNGRTWAESSLGEGSTFYFNIPSTPVKEMKPIKVLFSSKAAIEKRVAELFEEIMGPLGAAEFNEIKGKGDITKEKLFKYADLIYKNGVITKDKLDNLKKSLAHIFGEIYKKGPMGKAEGISSEEKISRFFEE